jgi:hypothetical protein
MKPACLADIDAQQIQVESQVDLAGDRCRKLDDEMLMRALCGRLFRSRLAQAFPAQAVLAGDRHRQSRGFIRAPARSARIARELGAASGTGKAAEGWAFCLICHEYPSKSSAVFSCRVHLERRYSLARLKRNGNSAKRT